MNSRLLPKLKELIRRPLITGTLILTLTGLLSRLIGFFYRIYLSRLFGEENMGIYQLVSPVIALSFSLTAGSYQTAVSKLTAEYAAKHAGLRNPLSKRPFWASLSISLPLSAICTFVTYSMAQPIAIHLLKEPRTIPLLRVIAFSFPFVGIHACINGWFYGMKKVAKGQVPSIGTAIFGLAVGEFVSMTVAILTFLPYFPKRPENPHAPSTPPQIITTSPASRLNPTPSLTVSWRCVYAGLLSMALPLTANRLTLTLLSSAESVAIPEMLRAYGYTSEGALSVYGVLTGMALPLIFFPNALTGSIAVMLLPMISENYCLHKMDVVRSLTLRTIKYTLLMGFFFLGIFVILGPFLGRTMFHSVLAGQCIRTLGWICPFLYLDVTLSSILQGLGKAGAIFAVNVLSLMMRLAFVYLAVPIFGIRGWLWGMLAGQLLLTVLYGICLRKFFRQSHFHVIE